MEPATAVVSKIRPDHAVADIRRDICALGNFMTSAGVATDWLSRYPQGQVVPITEDYEVNRKAMAELGWL